MLTLKQIRDERDVTVARLAKKGVDAAPIIDKIIALDDRRKAIQQQLDGNLSEQNKIAKEIGGLFKSGKADEANALKEKVAGLKEQVESLRRDYANLKTAKMLDVSSGEIRDAKSRLSRLVREVDKCIALLNV